MTTGRRQSTRPSLAFTIISLFLAATALVVTTTSATAADGAQTAPTFTPSPVASADDNFALSNGACDGTGGDGWRVQTFIVNDGVSIGTLVFDQGPFSDRVGTDRDNSDSTIRSPLWKGNAPGTGYNPAASPAGLIDPSELSAFDFSSAGWVLTDGDYQIGYVCLDELSMLRQWWSLTVTIDADASPNPFMVVSEGAPEPESTAVAVTAAPPSSTVGADVTFTATVTPAGAAGNVEFFLGGVSQSTDAVAAGAATWSTSALTQGTKSITATFTPSNLSLFTGSTSPTLSYTVASAAAQATSTALTAAPASQAAEGQLVTLTAAVTPSGAVGTVTFAADGSSLGSAVAVDGGAASLATTALELGERSLTATFAPTDPGAYAGSTGTLAYTVVASDGEETVVELVSDPPDQAAVGAEVTFTATVEPAAAGTMTFVEDGQVIGGPVDVSEGAARYVTSDLAEGVHSIVAAFTPADTEAFQPSSSAALSLTVGTTTPTTTADTVPPGTTDGFTDVLGSGTLPVTGGRLTVAGVGLVLIYVGRVLYLIGRPRLSAMRR